MSAARTNPGVASLIVLTGAAGACAAPPELQTTPTEPVTLALANEPLHRHHDVVLESDPDHVGGLRSLVITDGRTFTEALPSWNVATAASFTVDVRVRSKDLVWSPWLRIGDWNVPTRTSAATTTFDEGRVAVDVLQLRSPMTELEIAFEPAAAGIALDPVDVSATVVLSSVEQLENARDLADAEPWPEPVRLQVPARSQREDGGEIGHRICSPTSIAMALSFHGVDVATDEVAATVRDPHHDIYGNWNRAVQGARAYGVQGRLARLSSWAAVAAVLTTGTPIIASIRADEGDLAGAPYPSTAGHLLMITGLGPEGTVHVNDPAGRTAEDVPRVYSREDLARVWIENGGVAYLLDSTIAVPTATPTTP